MKAIFDLNSAKLFDAKLEADLIYRSEGDVWDFSLAIKGGHVFTMGYDRPVPNHYPAKAMIECLGKVIVLMASEAAAQDERIKDMEERLKILDALESAGVDNWSGYSYAMEVVTAYENPTKSKEIG